MKGCWGPELEPSVEVRRIVVWCNPFHEGRGM